MSKVICVCMAVLAMLSCGGRTAPTSFSSTLQEDNSEGRAEESVPAAEEDAEELRLEEEDDSRLDGVFNDFLFAYLHSRALRRERTAKPLRLERKDSPAEMLEQFDPEFELGFLSGDYFTTLYGGDAQMQAEDDEEFEEDSIVSLQRINLNDGTIRNFMFIREEGQWRLDAIREATFADDDLCDFLGFYARFSSDSIFQMHSIATPLHIVLQSTEDEGEVTSGTIDADQWQSFCPDVPGGIISNIRKGQSYGPHRIVLRKSGLSNGLQEVFTFARDRGEWRLTKYEN